MNTKSIEKQLQEVNILLEKEPNNAGYLELMMTLTEALHMFNDDGSGDSGDSGDSNGEDSDVNDETDLVIEKETSRTTDTTDSTKDSWTRKRDIASHDTQLSSQSRKIMDDQNVNYKTDLFSNNKSNEKPLAKKVKTESNIDNIMLGSRCEVFDDGKGTWQSALLDTYEDARGKVTVTTIHDKQAKKIAPSYVRPMKSKRLSYDMTKLRIGQHCKAIFSSDMKWYPATIMQVTLNGCVVQFEKYRNQEEVAFEHLEVDVDQKIVEDDKNVSKSAVVAGIPKHLQPLPTDSEKVKARKQKTMDRLRKETNKAQKDLILVKKQQSWQTFQAKTKRKKKT